MPVDVFAEKMAALSRTFRAQLPDRLLEMQGLLIDGSYAELREIAHRIAGQGGTFGAPEISAAAAEVEEADDMRLPEALAALGAAIGKVH